MSRLCPSAVAFCFALTTMSGCSGRTIAGVWVGPLPLTNADSCRMRLYKGGTFDFTCSGKDPWVGGGYYTLARDTLTLEIDALAKGPETIQSKPAPITATVSGPGNEIELRLDTGRKLVWKRTLE